MLLNFIITKAPLTSLQHNAEGIKKLFSETTSEINTDLIYTLQTIIRVQIKKVSGSKK